MSVIRAAINDPGKFAVVANGEPVTTWQARAVQVALERLGWKVIRADELERSAPERKTRQPRERRQPASVATESPLKLHSIPTTAQLLGCSKMHVYRLIANGELRPVDTGAGRSKTRIRSDDLADYIERKSNGDPENEMPVPE
jgi:excisionase family DNA binding protein